MQKQNHDFQVGDRIVLSYPYVEPRNYLGTVVRITPKSLHIQIDGDKSPTRYFILRGRWRNQFGNAVWFDPQKKTVADEPQSAAI